LVGSRSLCVLLCAGLLGCRSEKSDSEPSPAPKQANAPSERTQRQLGNAGQPAVLYLPAEGLGVVDSVPRERVGFWEQPLAGRRRCPAEMVDVRGEYCIDRFEASLQDERTHRPLSPFYPANVRDTQHWFKQGQMLRGSARTEAGRSLAVPVPPEVQLTGSVKPMAISLQNQLPNGYMSGEAAARACQNAGKRLCTASEWRSACRGQKQSRYPYGDEYRPGLCNVFRATHPAGVLHGNPSLHHLDPRLNLVADSEGPLLRKTGELATCRSEFGNDAVFDMVGNLDEWVAGPPGLFLGGFYARATRDGCDSEISVHAYEYLDYSLGFRCCL